ncbi:Rrf2 family transcriptional regulator [Candidatus Sumerlaeota bacterium]|nr:Rrf2 family transcriptional regulator [Candidatus Sumerlaeota bacterium]
MLRVSTKGRYAARIMVRLALSGTSAPARKQDVARAEGISSDYVEQILMKLKTAGLVVSHRGARGGFTLARPPHEITLADVLEATEGPLSFAPCVEDRCERATVCVTQAVWREANDALHRIFAAKTIGALAFEAGHLKSKGTLNFQI